MVEIWHHALLIKHKEIAYDFKFLKMLGVSYFEEYLFYAWDNRVSTQVSVERSLFNANVFTYTHASLEHQQLGGMQIPCLINSEGCRINFEFFIFSNIFFQLNFYFLIGYLPS